ncbi:hypothetical protein GY21_13570 [Cryobacterium roopkundense]|nr:hypothetical protein GY21_13570 [Cryobacterium roopkundense]
MVMLMDLYAAWPEDEHFVNANELVRRLIQRNPDYWDTASAYGRALTVQRLGRTLVQIKIRSSKNSRDQRGYARADFLKSWRQSGIIPRIEPVEPSGSGEASANTPVFEPVEPSQTVEPATARTICRVCSAPLLAPASRAAGICGKRNPEHDAERVAA